MKGLVLAAVSGTAVVTAAAWAQLGPSEPQPQTLWLRMPGRADIDRAYPGGAARRGISGSVMLVCRAAPVTLVVCRVESEEPAGLGFGKAAVSAARWFTILPQTGSAPREVKVRIDFVPPRRAVLLPQPGDDGSSPRRNLVFWNGPPPYNGEHGSKQADDLHIAGMSLLRCRVEADGKLTGCDVLKEDPAGWGFGKGAISAVRHLRLERKTLGGSPTVGRLVDVPVIYNPECSSYPDPSGVEWCAGGQYGAPHLGSLY